MSERKYDFFGGEIEKPSELIGPVETVLSLLKVLGDKEVCVKFVREEEEKTTQQIKTVHKLIRMTYVTRTLDDDLLIRLDQMSRKEQDYWTKWYWKKRAMAFSHWTYFIRIGKRNVKRIRFKEAEIEVGAFAVSCEMRSCADMTKKQMGEMIDMLINALNNNIDHLGDKNRKEFEDMKNTFEINAINKLRAKS